MSLPKLFFLHIHKCAGTSLRYLLADIYPRDWILPVALGRSQANIPQYPTVAMPEREYMSQMEPEQYRLIMGHYDARVLAMLSEDWLTMTVLRDPVDQLVSAYHFVDRARDIYGEMYEQTTLIDFAGLTRFTNRQTAMLSGYFHDDKPVDAVALEIAKRNVDRMNIVGRVEEIPALLEQLIEHDLPAFFLPRHNARRKDPPPLTTDERKAVEAAQWADCALLEHVFCKAKG